MAERKIDGADVLLFIDPAGGTAYDLIVCLTANSFNAALNEIDSKTKCGADKAPGTPSFEVSFEGQIIYSPDTDRVSTGSLYTLLTGKTTVGWKMGKATPVTGDIVYSGTAFISKLDQTFPEEGRATFSGALGIYGTPTQTITA